MKRIILHWSAGGLAPNCVDKEHYHFLVDGFGQVHKGYFEPEANLKCVEGRYAAHTGGGNTGSIGIALCGMLGFQNSKNPGKYVIKQVQVEACLAFIAQLCKKYSIKVSSETVMTHYEFGKKHPNTTSFGKIDIIYLPPYPTVKANEIGNFLRKKIQWYLGRL